MQRLQLEAEHFLVPARVFRDLVVRDDERALLRWAEIVQHDDRNLIEAQLLRRRQPTMASDDHAVRTDQDGVCEPELADGIGDLRDLPGGVRPRIARVGHQPRRGHHFNFHGRPDQR